MSINDNPFGKEKPLKGKDLDWYLWRLKYRTNANPYLLKTGGIAKGKMTPFFEYLDKVKIETKNDLSMLTESVAKEIVESGKALSRRMSTEY